MTLRKMEILIVKLSAIGDVIHTLPALDALHHNFPESNITWLVEEKSCDIINDHPYLKRVVVSKRKRWLKDLKKPSLWYHTLKEITVFIIELRSKDYDWVIDFQGLLKSGLLVFLSRGKRKIGYDRTRELSYFFLNERIPPYSLDQHAVERNMNIVRFLGVKPDRVAFDPLEKKLNNFGNGLKTNQNSTTGFTIPIGEEDKSKVQRFLSANKISTSRLLIAINSQAGWVTKLWQPLKMAKLSDRLIENYGAQIIFTGGKDDYQSIEDILSLMEHKALNSSGETSLKELSFLLSLSDLMITTDSGPMHIASAMGTPTVALFGPTAPWRTGPYSNNAIILRNNISCSPCFKRKCDIKSCMDRISVEEVLDAVVKQLGHGDANN